VACTDGPNMSPPVTLDQACNFALVYFEWEAAYDSNIKDTYYPVTQSSVFIDPTLIGPPCVGDNVTFEVTQGYFQRGGGWNMLYAVGSGATNFASTVSPNYNKNLKRKFDYTMFTVDATQVIQAITSKPDYKSFLIWLAGVGHNGMHLFFSYPMQTQHSPDEPFFFPSSL